MPFDQTRFRPNLGAFADSTAAGADLPKTSGMREVEKLREVAAWYREFVQRAGNPTIWQSRLRMAEDLASEADRLEREHLDRPAALPAAPAETRPLDPRTRLLLEAPILPTLLRLPSRTITVMLVMASTGLIETWWVSRLGTDALAGIALVFPLYMMMQMLSAGAMGGGISSAIARALGGGRREDGGALGLHAIIVNLTIGIVCSVLVIVFGPVLYRAM